MSENVILIGFMGTGKDAVGRALAAQTGWAFLSIDMMIELQEHKRVAEIFGQYGEAFFRAKERDAIDRVKKLRHTIVATGGGSLLDGDNRYSLKHMGYVICLTAEARVLEERILSSMDRPLATCPEDVRVLLETRRKVYACADRTFDTTSKKPDAVAAEILQEFPLHGRDADVRPRCVPVSTGQTAYPVHIGSVLCEALLLTIDQAPAAEKIVIVTNPLVGALYGEEVVTLLEKKCRSVHQHVIPDGEFHKNLRTASCLYDFLAGQRVSRNDMLIALGGGVVCDIAGFVASTYKRGIQLVHIPTTLLAQVDAAIGGKSGLDHVLGKNLIGTFYHPAAVVCDISFLASLSEQEYRNGLAEIIKYALIEDAGLFTLLKEKSTLIKARDMSLMAEVITRCVTVKGRIVGADEREGRNIRPRLNFGHTVGHAIESLHGYHNISHGQAIALGMVAEMEWAVRQGLLSRKTAVEAVGLIASYGLPTVLPESSGAQGIRDFITQDKKAHQGVLSLPVVTDIGNSVIKEVACEHFL